MLDNDRQPNSRKPYQQPTLERVILDPIKEMLTACTTDPNAKNTTDCTILETTLS
ncbi:MAG TPA: hypothetical protein VHM30_15835 [Gemmatimonadaceae bacterium]|nr:hypothetical protein [Gemmatimonadaceae bacterium]